jgi:hypothetical protein
LGVELCLVMRTRPAAKRLVPATVRANTRQPQSGLDELEHSAKRFEDDNDQLRAGAGSTQISTIYAVGDIQAWQASVPSSNKQL